MRLAENILRFERHLENAEKLKNRDVSDYFVYNTLAMECFQAVNALLEIGEYIVTKKKLGFPSTYREIFELLKQHGEMTEEMLSASKKLVFLRNLIAHEYYRIEEKELLEMIELLGVMREFVQKAKEER